MKFILGGLFLVFFGQFDICLGPCEWNYVMGGTEVTAEWARFPPFAVLYQFLDRDT